MPGGIPRSTFDGEIGVAAQGDGVNGRTAADARDIHDELVLDQIRDAYSADFDIGYADGAYHARRLAGGPLLTAATPGGLATAIWTDWTRNSAARRSGFSNRRHLSCPHALPKATTPCPPTR